jgi:hypothetical protein
VVRDPARVPRRACCGRATEARAGRLRTRRFARVPAPAPIRSPFETRRTALSSVATTRKKLKRSTTQP